MDHIKAAESQSAKRTMTISEAARELGISRNSGYEAARRGEIPTVRVGRLLLVPRVAFERMLGGAGLLKEGR